jgi:hypothetical protein
LDSGGTKHRRLRTAVISNRKTASFVYSSGSQLGWESPWRDMVILGRALRLEINYDVSGLTARHSAHNQGLFNTLTCIRTIKEFLENAEKPEHP